MGTSDRCHGAGGAEWGLAVERGLGSARQRQSHVSGRRVARSQVGAQQEGIRAQPSEALRLGQAQRLLLCARWGRPCLA